MIAVSQRFWYTTIMKNDGKFKKGSMPWNKGVTGYMGANRTSYKKGDNSVPLQERFDAKVVKGEKCWIWMAHKNNKGYGVIHFNGKVTLAHRIAYTHSNGVIPDGMKICHTCDNPPCVNPQHLFLGTQMDNLRDMAKKGRWGNKYKKNT